MRNLTTHQEVHPDEWSRRYDVLVTDGLKGNGLAIAKRKMTIHFWFSPGIISLERKTTDKNEEYLEVIINMKMHRKLTTGWNSIQRPRYGIFNVGIRVVGEIDPKNDDLMNDDPLSVRRERIAD